MALKDDSRSQCTFGLGSPLAVLHSARLDNSLKDLFLLFIDHGKISNSIGGVQSDLSQVVDLSSVSPSIDWLDIVMSLKIVSISVQIGDRIFLTL